MDFKELAQTPCAVCTQSIAKWDILAVPPDNIDFSLLQNHFLPIETLPTMYNIDAYNRAILYPLALHNVKAQDTMDMCQLCYYLLVICKKQLVDSLVNFQYYAIAKLPAKTKRAFESTSMFDLMRHAPGLPNHSPVFIKNELCGGCIRVTRVHKSECCHFSPGCHSHLRLSTPWT